MRKYLYILVGVFVIGNAKYLFAQSAVAQIYCTSNRDGTGICWNDKTGQSVDCVAIPGETIACSDPVISKLNCVAVGWLLFSCYPGEGIGIRERFSDNQDPRGTFRDRLDPQSSPQRKVVDPNRVIAPGIDVSPLRKEPVDIDQNDLPSLF